ncbi:MULTISPECIES: flagellar biosynthetic protein FliR [Deefgea]|uniref:Flagellar biosynthetic protein FliR n=1 Tax=Deefgea chitinilytica TaxID=570276 RepID=A0ABS2CGH8_9NEIS|nr:MULTISPECIES: flagellar biosynthetic protein FliR [Deefgea]MBM5572815.1 flagellar biosynthetic protein FliR [Deefgea chitinilytica]MBM9890052.1 flagellar biosynthetic protein FliR [Deefgea sp. CFH1-16]
MITFTQAQIEIWLALFWWPFLRIFGLLLADPFFSSRAIQLKIRVALAILLTILIGPLLPTLPTVPVVSPEGMLIAIRELIIGLSIGFVMRLIFTSVEMAGHLSGLQMGLGFASFYDPQNASNSLVISQLMSLFMLLSFLSVGGHLVVLRVLIDSMVQLPLGTVRISADGFQLIANYGAIIFRTGVLLALPVLAALLIANLAIGVMTRAAPQLNVFAVGFPLTLGVGFAAMYFSLPMLVPHIDQAINNYTRYIAQILLTFSQK